LHVVCAYSDEDNLAIVITVYQPDPEKKNGSTIGEENNEMRYL